MAVPIRDVLVKHGQYVAAIEDGRLVIEGPGIAGELVRSRLPANLEWLQEYLGFVEEAGDALARKIAAAQKAKRNA